MKKFDWTVFFPGQVTFLLLPGELIGVRSVHVGGRGRSTHARSWACADREALSRSLLAAREELGVGKDTLCHVGLPLGDMTLVEFSLPLAARDDLDNAVRYALMRHVPFDLDGFRWEFDAVEEQGEVAVAVTLMHRQTLAAVMDRFSSAGVPVATVFPACMVLFPHIPDGGVAALTRGGAADAVIWNGRRICWQQGGAESPSALVVRAAGLLESYGVESRSVAVLGPALEVPEARSIAPEELDLGGPRRFRINVISERAIRGRRRARQAVLWAAALLICTLLLLPFRDVLVWERRVSALEERVGELRQEADSLINMREQSAAFEKRMERWSRTFASNVDMGRILREVTELMPAGAWLDNLQIQERRIVVAGNAPSATFVLEQMEISSLFQDARFDAPVTRQGQLEVFRIAATISPQ